MKVLKADVTPIVAELEQLAVKNQIEFVYDGRLVAGYGDVLVIDPTVEVPVEVVGNTIRVHVVPQES